MQWRRHICTMEADPDGMCICDQPGARKRAAMGVAHAWWEEPLWRWLDAREAASTFRVFGARNVYTRMFHPIEYRRWRKRQDALEHAVIGALWGQEPDLH